MTLLFNMPQISCSAVALATVLPFCFYIVLVMHSFSVFHRDNGESCPLGLFPCGRNSSVCITQTQWCDHEEQCPNGEDEDPSTCSEFEGRDYSEALEEGCWPYYNSDNRTTHRCDIDKYPDNCTCEPEFLVCVALNLQSIPSGFSISGEALSFADNSIAEIQQSDFMNFSHLISLKLQINSIRNLTPGVFKHLINLKKLSLSQNKLSRIVSGAFRGLNNLAMLLLDENQIREIHRGAFDELTSLCFLWLQDNQLTLIFSDIFLSTANLLLINLGNNLIENIRETTFSKLPKLNVLTLSNNSILRIEPYSFEETKHLHELDLSHNRIDRFPSQLQNGNGSLKYLSLASNPIEEFSKDDFTSLTNLVTLNLSGIRPSKTYRDVFLRLDKLEVIHLGSFEMCRYAPVVRDCKPRGDGISSIQNLLEITLLRLAIWVVALTTCVGNAAVMIFRVLFHDERTVHALFIQHLAAADFLMGIYLLIIGTHDVFFRDQYNRLALKWMDSWTCQAAGIIALVSSEVSVLILTCMSFECCLKIIFPYLPFTLSQRSRFIILSMVWMTGVVTAAIPFSSRPMFGESFYGSNGVCFPLHIHDPFQLGWQYSAFIFIGVNMTSLITVMICNFGICFSLHRTKSAVPKLCSQETITKRLLAITLANTLCWTPVITIKILALADGHCPDQLYAWLTIFVLPINSALDPLIYTLTTPNFKRQLREHFTIQNFFNCSHCLLDFVSFRSKSVNKTPNLHVDYIDLRDRSPQQTDELSQNASKL